MNHYDELIQVLDVLSSSSKWTGNWSNGEAIGEKKFVYVPYNGAKYTSLTIPTINNEPDLSRPFVGKILMPNYILVQVRFVPLGKTWPEFLSWLKTMVNNPESLLDE